MDTLEEVSRKLDILIEKMEILEKALKMQDSPVLSTLLKGMKLETDLASNILKGYDRFERFRKYTKDDISLAILRILMRYDALNILQITKKVRVLRGRASRRIVRRKLEDLKERGLVVEEEDKRRRIFRIKEGALLRNSNRKIH
ncbi:MAG: hypothetical protein ACE5K0_10010 [Candidatus Methanofastidiosia archaeon]